MEQHVWDVEQHVWDVEQHVWDVEQLVRDVALAHDAGHTPQLTSAFSNRPVDAPRRLQIGGIRHFQFRGR